MARLKSASGLKLVIRADYQGDGVKRAICSINAERGISFDSEVGQSPDIDCDDPEAIAWLLREKTSHSVTVTGGGTFDTPNGPYLWEWWKSGEARDVDIVVDVAEADGGMVFSGEFLLTTFNLSGNRGEKMTSPMTLMSSGEVTMAANS